MKNETSIVIHIMHALARGARTVQVRTVDTDTVVILVGTFFDLKHRCSDIQLWVAFGTGKDIRQYHINTISETLG